MARMYSTDSINSLQIKLFLCNYRILDKNWQSDNVSDPVSRLYYIKSGNGWVKYGDKKVFLEGGKVYLIPSGMEISYGCTKLEKIFFHITVCGFEKTDILSVFSDIYSLPFSESDFDLLLKITNSEDFRDKLRLKQILYSTVMDFFDNFFEGSMPVPEYSDTVKKTILYIQKNLSMSLTCKDIANALFLSPTTIRTMFKKETGMTIGSYIDDLIFSGISNLLANEKISVSEISRKFGFCDAYYLSRRFKEKYKQTPTEYRRTYSK